MLCSAEPNCSSTGDSSVLDGVCEELDAREKVQLSLLVARGSPRKLKLTLSSPEIGRGWNDGLAACAGMLELGAVAHSACDLEVDTHDCRDVAL